MTCVDRSAGIPSPYGMGGMRYPPGYGGAPVAQGRGPHGHYGHPPSGGSPYGYPPSPMGSGGIGYYGSGAGAYAGYGCEIMCTLNFDLMVCLLHRGSAPQGGGYAGAYGGATPSGRIHDDVGADPSMGMHSGPGPSGHVGGYGMGPRGTDPSSPGGAPGGYGTSSPMPQPQTYSYGAAMAGYGGAYVGYGQVPSGGPSPSQSPRMDNMNMDSYGGIRGGGAMQSRIDRSFRPY